MEQPSVKEQVDGIVLITSCKKHYSTRVQALAVPEYYGRWKVHIVLGNPALDVPFKITGMFLTVRCEDSYIHLLKKVALAISALYQSYDIQKGIVRAGDDLVFNDHLFSQFLETATTPGVDCVGKVSGTPLRKSQPKTRTDKFMYQYYRKHPEDFCDPLHGLQDVTLEKLLAYSRVPEGEYAIGVLAYFSSRACKAVLSHMSERNFDVFCPEDVDGTTAFPYTIEDLGIGYILRRHGMSIVPKHDTFADKPTPHALAVQVKRR